MICFGLPLLGHCLLSAFASQSEVHANFILTRIIQTGWASDVASCNGLAVTVSCNIPSCEANEMNESS